MVVRYDTRWGKTTPKASAGRPASEVETGKSRTRRETHDRLICIASINVFVLQYRV